LRQVIRRDVDGGPAFAEAHRNEPGGTVENTLYAEREFQRLFQSVMLCPGCGINSPGRSQVKEIASEASFGVDCFG